MAIRRAKQKRQVIAKLSQEAPPGETFIACVHVETGPSPWLNGLFDEVPLLGIIIAFSRKLYFLTLTNTSIVVNTCSRFRNQPGAIVASYHREAFPATRIKRGRVWSVLYLEFPGNPKPVRLNVHRFWRGEFDQLVSVLPSSDLDPTDPGRAS